MIKKYRFSIVLSFIILILSLAGPATFERVDLLEMTFSDKLAHMVMYFALMLSVTWENSMYTVKPSVISLLAFIVFAYGTLMELFQEYLTVNRTGSFWDGVFNTLGIILAAGVLLLFRIYVRKKKIR